MANVPTILAERGLRSGATGPQSSAADFGEFKGNQLEQLGSGLQNLAKGVESFNLDRMEVKKHVDNLNAEIYNAEATAKLRKFSTDFYAQNHGKDTLHSDYFDQATSYIDSAIEQAPTPESKAQLRRTLDSVRDEHYSDFSKQVVTQKLYRGRDALLESTAASIGSFNTSFARDPANSFASYQKQITETLDSADKMFLAQAPHMAAGVRNEIIKQAVSGIIDTSPSSARRLIDSFSGRIEGDTRQTLIRSIDAADAVNRQIDAMQLTQDVQDVGTAMRLGNNPDPVTLSKIKDPTVWDRAFGKKGGERYAEAMKEVGMLEGVLKGFDTVRAWNPTAKRFWLDEQRAKVTDVASARAYETAHRMVDESNARMLADPVQFILDTHQQEFQGLANRIVTTFGDPQENAKARADYQQRLLFYQGTPPAEGFNEMTEDQRRQFLSLDNRALLSGGEVKQLQASIDNASGPDQVFQVLKDVRNRFVTPEQYQIALLDLFKNKPEMGRRWAGIAANLDKPWIQTAIDAERNQQKGLEHPNEETFKTMEDRLKNSTTFTNFKRAFAYTHPDEVGTYEHLILSMAKHIASSGKVKPADAVDQATELAIGSNLTFSTLPHAGWMGRTGELHPFNGAFNDPLPIPKEAAGKPVDDVFAAQIPARLSRLLDRVDTDGVDWDRIRPMMQGWLKEHRDEEISSLIHDRGQFSLSDDGSSYELRILSDFKDYPVLKDMRGRPFRISIEDLRSVPDHPDDVRPVETVRGLGEAEANAAIIRERSVMEAQRKSYTETLPSWKLPNSFWPRK